MYHGYEPQSELWKQFRSKLRGIISMHMQDNSTYKLKYTLFLKLGFITLRFAGLFDLQISIHFVFEI
jgi:hypothetical protein